MSMSDPLADMLTRIRNANMVKHDTVEIPYSKMKAHVAENLKSEGYINGFDLIEDSKQGILKVDLKYTSDNTRVITGIKRVSKPGCRVYVQSSDIPKVMSGLGISILSTSKGVISDKEARKLGIGGELLCDVW
ncbi:MAG: 30S ribosomal protein S8 [Desulfobulbaceae bacterium]|jgi:small subunit ribosomal protein S8|nr:30S ribosomal protein S8 [Desulfobulbaceae bacterium]